ncbi:hypothetical protein TrVE_jg1943 [Triparma verrucosa]|uniref:Uncharacterized protein n=1 Tax=Triparma verrucosa TaxID=1606542 RepID=A0A9W7ESA6_9STRA|nr:hypothetical protein TrVE_jg1943 [Triparma verrucosa]
MSSPQPLSKNQLRRRRLAALSGGDPSSGSTSAKKSKTSAPINATSAPINAFTKMMTAVATPATAMNQISDPFLNSTSGTRSCVIYLALDEHSQFFAGFSKCAKICSKSVQKSCFQRDGTRHVSMWQGKLSSSRVNALSLSTAALPLPVSVTGWKSWNQGNYLSIDSASTATLKAMLEGLGLPKGKVACDHISLYRKRGQNDSFTNAQLEKVKEELKGFDWGDVTGVSVRIKIIGRDYSEFKVLA